jgi:ACT domain-containing protein
MKTTPKIIRNPTKKAQLSRKQKKFIAEYVKSIATISDTTKAIGINRSTYYEWMKNPLFRQALEDEEENYNDLIIRNIRHYALTRDKEMLKFWAKTQMKHRGFTERTEVENRINVSFRDELLSKREFVDNLSDDLKEELLKWKRSGDTKD